jgi:hypothetical protein
MLEYFVPEKVWVTMILVCLVVALNRHSSSPFDEVSCFFRISFLATARKTNTCDAQQ